MTKLDSSLTAPVITRPDRCVTVKKVCSYVEPCTFVITDYINEYLLYFN